MNHFSGAQNLYFSYSTCCYSRIPKTFSISFFNRFFVIKKLGALTQAHVREENNQRITEIIRNLNLIGCKKNYLHIWYFYNVSKG